MAAVLGMETMISPGSKETRMKAATSSIRITLGTWDRLREDATSVRHEVFVVEQRVPVEVELDDDDAVSVHAVAYDTDGTAVGTGRLLPDGHIGRMAVRKRARGLGVGGQILDALIGQGTATGTACWCCTRRRTPPVSTKRTGSRWKARNSWKPASPMS